MGMMFFADMFQLEVLSGFIVMFCRIWTQPSSKGHQDIDMEEIRDSDALVRAVKNLRGAQRHALHQALVAKVHIADDRDACPWFAVWVGVMARHVNFG